MPNPFTIYAPIDGELISLSRVPDPVFSQRMLGDGIAIDPAGDTIVAPFDGKIVNFNPSLHAFTVVKNDIEVLIHVGVETVMLNGEGFSPLVAEGDEVKKGQPLLQFHPTFLAQRLSCAYVLIVVTSPAGITLTHRAQATTIRQGDPLFQVDSEGSQAETTVSTQQTTSSVLANVRLYDNPEELVNIYMKDGHIEKITPACADAPGQIDGNGAYALPGFIDLHIHGFGGFGPELGTQESLLKMSDELLKQGVTSFCPTLYCGQPADMENLLRTLSPAVGKERGARILGFHLEGPFISPQKPGVMKPQDIAPANVEVFKRLYEAADGKIISMTLAPELANIQPVVNFCREHHILLQAGHTNATYDEMMQAKMWGITHATHFCNAMSPFHHRSPGATGAVLMDNNFSCEVIADGVHVHPAIVSFLRRAKTTDKIILVTDALLPTGQKEGPFYANGEEVVLEGGVWRRKKDQVIAGSALTMLQGFKNLMAWGYSLEDAVACASVNPARLIGREDLGLLKEGSSADILLLDKNLHLQKVIHG